MPGNMKLEVFPPSNSGVGRKVLTTLSDQLTHTINNGSRPVTGLWTLIVSSDLAAQFDIYWQLPSVSGPVTPSGPTTPGLNLSQIAPDGPLSREVLSKWYGYDNLHLPSSSVKRYYFSVSPPIAPSNFNPRRVIVNFQENSDTECGSLTVVVKHVDSRGSVLEQKSAGPLATGQIEFSSLVNDQQNPNIDLSGLYLVTVTAGQSASGCPDKYRVMWTWS